MSETNSEEKKQDALAPPSPDQGSAEPAPEPNPSREDRLQQARVFLQDAQVQNTNRERKAEFLKSKGLSERDIQELLQEETRDGQAQSQATASEERIEPPLTKKEDRPPIVTYPEFLTKPARPPPLVTVNGFLNTLYAFGALSTVVYGASKYVVEPMVHTLTEARISLHDTATQDLAKLVSKLESTVSELPPAKAKSVAAGSDKDTDDAVSSYDDPTELFHRDVGVQTSPPASPSPLNAALASPPDENGTAQQMRSLFPLVTSLKSLGDSVAKGTESLEDVQTAVDRLKEDADKLNAPPAAGGFSLYGMSSRNEPDDEIKKAKENIRRVKGVLLSTRSFPASR